MKAFLDYNSPGGPILSRVDADGKLTVAGKTKKLTSDEKRKERFKQLDKKQ